MSDMNSLIRIAAPTLLFAAFLLVALRAQSVQAGDTSGCQRLWGSWETTAAQTSLILNIEPNREALVVWIRPGQHSMLRTPWEPFHGGILIKAFPRIRLWPGRDNRDDELRAELETIPELKLDSKNAFSDHFFMGRIKFTEMPQQLLLEHPVPKEWIFETLDEEWNSTAGRTRLPRNAKQKMDNENTPSGK